METELIRNVGIVAHIDAGKTTTTERILYYSGKNYRIGEVDEGAATMDWMPQEQERGITITAAATTCFWQLENKNYQINIIDTPGHVDFTIEVERSLRVLDGVVVVICGVAGIQPQTETVWRQANKFRVPRIVFINKLDRSGADFYQAMDALQTKFTISAVAITIPYIIAEQFCGIIDLVTEKLHIYSDQEFGKQIDIQEIPASHRQLTTKMRILLLDQAALFDDQLLEILVENKIPDNKLIIAALKKGLLSHKIVPTFAGSAFKNKGVQDLINGIVNFLPNPIEAEPAIAKDRAGVSQFINCEASGPPLALLYKVQIDAYAGMLSYLRVYRGELVSGKTYWNETSQKRERILKLFRIHANKRELIDKIEAGDIAAAGGFNNSLTGDTFTEQDNPLLLETINIPQPVIEIAIELKIGSDSNQLADYLQKLVREDPSLLFFKDNESGQSILAGMGELHLEIAIDRLKREAGVLVNIGKPRVAIRETITKKATATEIYDKPLLGKSTFAKVTVELSPINNNGINKIIIASNITKDKNLIKMLYDGCFESLKVGVLTGNSMINVQAKIIEIEINQNLFQLESFKIASNLAIRKCLLQAQCKELTPQMLLKTTIPTEYLGQVINDLNSRDAKILAIEETDQDKSIKAHTPLNKLIGYMTDLRSLTQGKGQYSMEFDHFG